MEENIVILGAGFGGLRAAMVLGKKAKRGTLGNHKVILIDQKDYHTYTPTLYEISTTSKEVANYIDLKSVNTFPLKLLLKRLPVKCIKAEIVKVDTERGTVHLRDGRHIPYRYLTIALGSETNFFDIPGLKERALELKCFTDAVHIRDKVWEAVEGASPEDELNIIIGGAGTTGVELTGEIQEWLAQLKKEGYGCKTNTTIINSSPTILPRFERKIIRKAERRLKKLGTKIVTSETIVRVTEKAVVLESGQNVTCDILMWTGGTKANALTDSFPVKKDKRGHIAVDSKLLCVPSKPDLKFRRKIYAIGDIVSLVNPKTGLPAQGVARVAISQANVVAKNIIRDIQGIDGYREYKPMNYPYIIPVGGKYAIAKFGPVIISGFFGWILKGLVELNYLLSVMPNDEASKTWLKGLKIFIQNDRLG